MNMLNKLSLGVAFCALLSLSVPVAADEIQDANKLFKQGQSAQALDKVNAYLAGKPKDAQARFLKGLIVNDRGDTAEAIKIFTGLTDDYPELPEPYNNLAVLYAGQGQYEKAKTALEMAIRTHPSYATAHENLGDIYAKMASQAYDRALQLDKSNTATQTKLALIRDLFGKTPRANKVEVATAATAATTAAVAAPAPIAVTPVAKPTAQKLPDTPAPASVAADNSGEVIKATQAWAAAWSAQNSDQYLAFYAAEFRTPNGEPRAAWEAQRKERIAKPSSIQVEVHNLKTKKLDDQYFSVSFTQNYRASHLNTSTAKTLVWAKAGANWRIVEERSGK